MPAFLNEIDEEEYLSVLDGLLAAKRKSVHAENEYELNGKLMRFALSRGFEMKDIRHCIQLSDEMMTLSEKSLYSFFYSHSVSVFLCHIYYK